MDEQTKRLIEESEARASKATEGPWDVWSSLGGQLSIHGRSRPFTVVPMVVNDNVMFIAHARTDVPALCAKVRELAERVEELEASDEQWQEYESHAMLQIGQEVVAGRTCERGELVYWINQIHEHYQEKLTERTEAAAAWDALAVARLKELNEKSETITAMAGEIRRLKEAYERECDKVLDLQGASPWKGD